MRRAAAVLTAGALTCALLGLNAAPASAAVPCSKGNVVLTFDDGPRAGTTADLLDVLRQRRVPSVFFVQGVNVVRYPSTVKRIARERHLVANHSWDHPDLRTLSYRGVQSQVRRTHRALGELGVPRARLMRPPYGATNPTVKAAIESLGFRQQMWTVDSDDWRPGRSASSIADRVLDRLHTNAIVLMHDGVGNSANTVRSVPKIVREARQRGYCFGLINDNGRVVPFRPRVRVQNTSVREGAAGTTTAAVFKVVLDYPTSREVSFDITTVDGRAKAPDDYRARAKTVTIAPGRTTAYVRVTVKGDNQRERDEGFGIKLSRMRAADISDGYGRAVIVNDDRG